MTKLTRFCCLVGVLLSLCCQTFGGFDHRVIPACDESEEVCKFEFDIRYKFSMVYYFNGYSTPIVIRNGTMMKRSVYNSEKFTPITPQGESIWLVCQYISPSVLMPGVPLSLCLSICRMYVCFCLPLSCMSGT